MLNYLPGDTETGRGRRRAEKADTVLRPVFRSRQISVDIRHPETEAHPRKVSSLRERCRKMLSPQTVLGAILDQKLRSELGTTPQFKVGSKSGSLARILTFTGITRYRNLTKGCTSISSRQMRVLPPPNATPTMKQRKPSQKSVRFLHYLMFE